MQLNTQTETTRSSAVMLVVVVVTVVGITGAAAAPQLLLQPLSGQFTPDSRGYATGYGYGGVQAPLAVQVGKAVHYADAPPPPAAFGYAPSYVFKPDLSAYAAASFPQVEQLRVFNPAVRPVHTVVPKVTAVEPSVTVQKTYVDVPEYRPVAVQQDAAVPHYYNYQLIDRK